MKKLVIGILAHVDAGKTTLSESMLYTSGSIRHLGRVDNKDAYLDNNAMERERGITIFSKQAEFSWKDMAITLLDTPGHVDFSAEMERTLKVLDYAVLVISGADARLQLAGEIKKRLEEGQYIKDPAVSVRIKGLKISVMGEVSNPGVHEMAGDRITLLEALSMAGDLTPTAKRTNILVLREEEGKRHTYTVDLTSGRDVLESPCYYLQQNDVVYVEPNKSINVKGSSALSYLGAGASIISVLASIVSLIVVLSK